MVAINCLRWQTMLENLDRVGPVDNRPSTDQLQNFVKNKEEEEKHVKCDMSHVTRYKWQAKCQT